MYHSICLIANKISNSKTKEEFNYPGKKGGDNTDYGDANMYLLEYFAKEYTKNGKSTPFSIDHYVSTYWLRQYEGVSQNQKFCCFLIQ